jgi:hypothetical protein
MSDKSAPVAPSSRFWVWASSTADLCGRSPKVTIRERSEMSISDLIRATAATSLATVGTLASLIPVIAVSLRGARVASVRHYLDIFNSYVTRVGAPIMRLGPRPRRSGRFAGTAIVDWGPRQGRQGGGTTSHAQLQPLRPASR